jgi:hypothetical protein
LALLTLLTLLALLALLPALLLLAFRPAFLPPAPCGIVLRRRRGLRQDDRRLCAVIGVGQAEIVAGMGRGEAREARKDGTCHQQTAEFCHLISYGCGVRPKPD